MPNMLRRGYSIYFGQVSGQVLLIIPKLCFWTSLNTPWVTFVLYLFLSIGTKIKVIIHLVVTEISLNTDGGDV